MGRLLTVGIASPQQMLFGATAERPLAANPGVMYYNTTSNQLEIYNGTAWHPVNDYERVNVTTSQAVTSNKSYWVNSSGGAVTLTLPASPVAGDFIKVTDTNGTFGTNNCILARNGNNIMRTADDMTISTPGASIRIVYHDATAGWLLEAI